MSKDRRTGLWAQVKAGDTIACQRLDGWPPRQIWSSGRVVRVTPTGIVVSNNGQRFRPSDDGSRGEQERGGFLRPHQAYALKDPRLPDGKWR